MSNLIETLNQTKEYLLAKIGEAPNIALTLGSGLSSFGEKIDIICEIPYVDIPNFIPPSIDGHKGKLVYGKVENTSVLIYSGRIHYYEGHSLDQVVFPTRVLAYLGVKNLILTNAAGGMQAGMSAGDLMIITDHINLTGQNPLLGPNVAEFGPRFLDLSNVYKKEFIEIAEDCLNKLGTPYKKGVYCGLTGPTYETPAEVKYLQSIGVSSVGMSTVPEAIVAKHMAMDLFAMSCITNLAAGISKEPLDHEEVKEVAKKVEKEFCDFLFQFVQKI